MKTKLLILFLSLVSLNVYAQDTQKEKSAEFYGHVMLDMGFNFKQADGNWYDVMRPTKLPSYENQYAPEGTIFAGVRQSRFGVKGYTPTPLGELKTQFEFELFGTGVDAGQTTFRLRHAYGELGEVGAGQTWSPFMDIDVFPNSLEYWGPNAMPFFRNVQLRWMPIQGPSRMTIALERPGASADAGLYADRIELGNVRPKFELPDFSAEYRHGGDFGYVELAGIVRQLKWDDLNDSDQVDLNGSALGWGLNLSSNINIGKDVVRLCVVYGAGIQNYMNDAPVDVGVKKNEGDLTRPIEGVALPMLGIVAFLDHTWSDKFTSSIGYSMLDIDNSDGQAPDAFKKGQYALVNLLYTPAPMMTTGLEFQWGNRENFSDGFTSDGMKVQLSFKYNFSQAFYR